jgi:hypothetical protein
MSPGSIIQSRARGAALGSPWLSWRAGVRPGYRFAMTISPLKVRMLSVALPSP